jgi:hypothetical protein
VLIGFGDELRDRIAVPRVEIRRSDTYLPYVSLQHGSCLLGRDFFGDERLCMAPTS